MTTTTATAKFTWPLPRAGHCRRRGQRPWPPPTTTGPTPYFDASCSAQKYAGMAQDFRASAWEHLDKGDLPQASNKAWGLVAETVKAISAYHGGIIHGHRAIWHGNYRAGAAGGRRRRYGQPGTGLTIPLLWRAACTPISMRTERRRMTFSPG